MTRSPLLVLSLAGLLLGACAARDATDRAVLLSEAPPPAPACEVVQVPERLPAADELVDAGRLAGQVSDYWASEDLEPGHLLLTLRYDAGGMNIRREVIEHTTPVSVADSVQKLVFDALRELEEERDGEWSVRLRLDVDQEVGLRVGRSEYCPPRPRDMEMERSMRQVHFRAPRVERGVRTRTITVRATIDPRGHVVGAHALTGPPLGTDLERRLTDHMRQFFFDPAVVDGVPVRGTVDVPVRVRGV